MEGQKRLDRGPKFVGNQFFCHARVLPNMAFLLGPLSADAFFGACAEFGVETVPVLYRGPYDLGTIKVLSEGPTTLGADHIREGVVVKPAAERTDPKVGRVCLKYIGDPYLFAKNITDSHDV